MVAVALGNPLKLMRAGVLCGATSAAGQAPTPPDPDTTMGTAEENRRARGGGG